MSFDIFLLHLVLSGRLDSTGEAEERTTKQTRRSKDRAINKHPVRSTSIKEYLSTPKRATLVRGGLLGVCCVLAHTADAKQKQQSFYSAALFCRGDWIRPAKPKSEQQNKRAGQKTEQ